MNVIDINDLSDREAEASLIGSIIAEPKQLSEVIDIISEKTIYDPKLQNIYGTIIALFNEGKPITIQQIKINAKNIDATELIDIVEKAEYIGIKEKAEYLKELEVKREIYKNHVKVLSLLKSKPINEIVSEMNVYNIDTNNGVRHIYEEAKITIQEVLQQQQDYRRNAPIQIPAIDFILRGIEKQELIGIAGRPGQGKTAFLIDLINYLAREGYNVLFYSVEMGATIITKRFIVNETEIDINKLDGIQKFQEGELKKMTDGVYKFKNRGIYLNCTSPIHVNTIATEVRFLKEKYKIDIVAIDYLQLLDGSGAGRNTRENEVTYTANTLKVIAKSNNIPVITAIQLNRDASEKRPTLSQLRESGGIEQALDKCIALYDPKPSEYKDEKKIEIIILKNRNGRIGNQEVIFEKSKYKFKEINEF